MPVTPNILLQAAAQAKTQAASAHPPAVAAEPGDKASSFSQVYALGTRPQPAADEAIRTTASQGRQLR